MEHGTMLLYEQAVAELASESGPWHGEAFATVVGVASGWLVQKTCVPACLRKLQKVCETLRTAQKMDQRPSALQVGPVMNVYFMQCMLGNILELLVHHPAGSV